MILNFSTILLLYEFVKPSNKLLFNLLIGSCSFFQLYGFLALPDAPSVFFSVLFFICYNRLIQHQNLSNSILMALCIAGMLYSKYHGLLLIGFTLLSNVKFLKSKYFYLTFLFSLTLLSPHIYWQFTHSFVAIKFQLVERTQSVYKISYFLSFFLQPIVLFGLAGPVLFYRLIKYRIANDYERTLYFNVVGVLFFFLIFSFFRRIEANWTNIIIGPLIILIYKSLESDFNSVKIYFRWLFLPTYILYIAGLAYFIVDYLPWEWSRSSEFHNQKLWADQIAKATQNKPVVFFNSYQLAAKYEFYSGNPALSLNDYRFRNNQYNFWPIEDSLLGKDVYIIPNWHERSFDSIETVRGTYSFRLVHNFASFERVRLESIKSSYTFLQGEPGMLNINLVVPDTLYFRYMKSSNSHIYYSYYKDGKEIKSILSETALMNLKTDKPNTLKIELPEEPGKYQLKICTQTDILQPTMNSSNVEIEIL